MQVSYKIISFQNTTLQDDIDYRKEQIEQLTLHIQALAKVKRPHSKYLKKFNTMWNKFEYIWHNKDRQKTWASFGGEVSISGHNDMCEAFSELITILRENNYHFGPDLDEYIDQFLFIYKKTEPNLLHKGFYLGVLQKLRELLTDVVLCTSNLESLDDINNDSQLSPAFKDLLPDHALPIIYENRRYFIVKDSKNNKIEVVEDLCRSHKLTVWTDKMKRALRSQALIS